MGNSEDSQKGVDNNIFIVRVTGKTSKTIVIPDTVCEFADIGFGDILKLDIKAIKKPSREKRKS